MDHSDLPSQDLNISRLRHLCEIDLSVRVINAIEAMACVTLNDVAALSEMRWLRQPNFGRKSLKELRGVLARFGLRFA